MGALVGAGTEAYVLAAGDAVSDGDEPEYAGEEYDMLDALFSRQMPLESVSLLPMPHRPNAGGAEGKPGSLARGKNYLSCKIDR
jgi:hypothetical protein